MDCQTLNELTNLSKRRSVDNGFMVRQEYNSLEGAVYKFEDDTILLIDDVIVEGNLSLFTKWQEKFFKEYLAVGGSVEDGTTSLDAIDAKLRQFDEWLGTYKGETDGK